MELILSTLRALGMFTICTLVITFLFIVFIHVYDRITNGKIEQYRPTKEKIDYPEPKLDMAYLKDLPDGNYEMTIVEAIAHNYPTGKLFRVDEQLVSVKRIWRANGRVGVIFSEKE